MSPEKPPSFESLFNQPPRKLEVAGSKIDSGVIYKRLQRIMEKLPRLRIDYNAYVIAHFGDRTSVSLQEFENMCRSLSLRPECLAEWDDEYFDNEFEETVRIARERGSHE